MKAYYQQDGILLYHGNCQVILTDIPANSIDAVICDPPYGLEFMGKDWDRLSTNPDVGKARKIGFEKMEGAPDQRPGNKGGTWFGSRNAESPNYYRTTNVKCRRCGKWKVSGGHDGRGNTLGCRCDVPDFPNAKADAARQMQAWHLNWAVEVFRVLKPGGHLLAFGGTRTYHRMACAIEDAGFEIRDCIQWWYGSGFPKSLDVSKAIDKQAGAEREVLGIHPFAARKGHKGSGNRIFDDTALNAVGDGLLTAPATEAAQQWQGWGTALKPANEPIVMARKPLSEPNVAANVLKWGTGAINIDGCRIGAEQRTYQGMSQGSKGRGVFRDDNWDAKGIRITVSGRWPANVILTHQPDCECVGVKQVEANGHYPASRGLGGLGTSGHGGQSDPDEQYTNGESIENWRCVEGCAVRELDSQSGVTKSTGGQGNNALRSDQRIYGKGRDNKTATDPGLGDVGGASRFFYVAKASRPERDCGLEDLQLQRSEYRPNDPTDSSLRTRLHNSIPQRNHHPTVKPVDLMRYLCRLVTPQGGTVLDPFMGSGTTGIACVLEGFTFIGIDMDEGYCAIAQKRIMHWTVEGLPLFALPVEV